MREVGRIRVTRGWEKGNKGKLGFFSGRPVIRFGIKRKPVGESVWIGESWEKMFN